MATLYTSHIDVTPRAEVNEVDPADPFTCIQLMKYGATRITFTDPAELRAWADVFAQAAADLADAKSRAAALPTGHAFVQPGQVAPELPAPDACMTCGQPETAHGSQS